MRASLVLVLLAPAIARAGDNTAADRGYQALTTRTFAPPIWSVRAYENAWTHWGVDERPADYARAVMDRYGLHPAPFDNGGLPMGLRKAAGLLGRGITNDCFACHAGSIAGQTVLGLGNASLDYQLLFDELYASDGLRFRPPFKLANVRGTVEAGALLTYLMEFRDQDLSILKKPLRLEYSDNLCEDIPAWWNLRKKKTMYHTGGANSRSVRSLMSFMLSPLNSADYIKKREPVFSDIHAWLLTLEPPKYPFDIDRPAAARGELVFRQNCVRCHGTYGPDSTYPNKHVPLDVIGTDPSLARGLSVDFLTHYALSWFGQETGPDGEPYIWPQVGYQAPPLDGVWATAPYFHNASVPTVYHVLNSKARPSVFTRSYRTEAEDYDRHKLGWVITELPDSAPENSALPAIERHRIYDTRQPGRANSGHTFGDHLTEEERLAVIEYLKTL